MRILDRYYLRGLLIPLAYCLCGFFVFWLTFDVFGELEDIQNAELGLGDIAIYYLNKLPGLLREVLPISLLLAMLYCLSHHARHNELIATRAAGVSMWRIMAIHLTIGTALGAGLFVINERWATGETVTLAMLQERRQAGEGDRERLFWKSPLHLRNEAAGRSWIAESYHSLTMALRQLDIQWELDRESLADLSSGTFADWPMQEDMLLKFKAESGGFTNGVWTFDNLEVWLTRQEWSDLPSVTYTNWAVRAIPEFTERPRQLRSEIRIAGLKNHELAKEARISIAEIADYEALHLELPPADRARLHTQYHGRLAWPLTCLVVVLIAIPFAAASGRRNVFVGVFASIVICFTYFVLMRLGLALGTGGSVPPWLGAWLPNIVFGGGASLLIARMP